MLPSCLRAFLTFSFESFTAVSPSAKFVDDQPRQGSHLHSIFDIVLTVLLVNNSAQSLYRWSTVISPGQSRKVVHVDAFMVSVWQSAAELNHLTLLRSQVRTTFQSDSRCESQARAKERSWIRTSDVAAD